MSDNGNISPILRLARLLQATSSRRPLVLEDIQKNTDDMSVRSLDWYMSSMKRVGLLKWRCQLDIAFDDESLLASLVGRTMTKAGALKQLRAFAQEAGLIDFYPNKDGFDYRDYDGEWEEIMNEMMEAGYDLDG